MTAEQTSATVRRALDQVYDPELDEPITDLGFVRSIECDADTIVVHLRLPTAFCSPNFAFMMASDAYDVLAPLANRVVVELDDHHDSEKINHGLATGAGYRGTFGDEADKDLESLRHTFRRKAHQAAMERAVAEAVGNGWGSAGAALAELRIGDLPVGSCRAALLRRRAAVGLPCRPDDPVLVDDGGGAATPDEAEVLLRRSRAVRISVEGNAQFCRGLLATRYPDAGARCPR